MDSGGRAPGQLSLTRTATATWPMTICDPGRNLDMTPGYDAGCQGRGDARADQPRFGESMSVAAPGPATQI